MQITIHKGPNDQTKRMVNSDAEHFQWNKADCRPKRNNERPIFPSKRTSVISNSVSPDANVLTSNSWKEV